jgi:hypothetical protein
MINYKIVEKEINNRKTYHIFEKQTENTICFFTEKKDATKYCRFLNLGGGFDGFTPSFLLKKNEKKSNNKKVLV